MKVNRYGQWAGGPDPLAPPYDVRAAVDQVGQGVLEGQSLREALRDLLRRGMDGRRGLDDLFNRARRMRRDALHRGRLDGTVTRAQQLLDQALAAERDTLRERGDDDARFAESMLDNLPRSTSRAVEQLSDYQWASDEARGLYQQILDRLRQEVVEQRFQGVKQAMNDPAAQAAMAAMLTDLNALLESHARGEDTTEQFARFMADHGQWFPENPETVDELIDAIGRRAAEGERLMRSLSAQQQEELARLMSQAMGPQAAGQLDRLGRNLRGLRPGLNWGRASQVKGPGALGYGEATEVLGEIGDLDDLLEQLGQSDPGSTLDDIDVELVERALGRDAADDVVALRELERELRRQGWVNRGSGGLTLSPKALRRLGGTALREVFAEIHSGSRGSHDVHSAGAGGELTGASRGWEFGDEQPLDVVRTVTKAVLRAGAGTPVTLEVEDFEVAETERRGGAAVALLIDLSLSMHLRDCWGPMKQTSLALAHLVATKFPQDALQVIGFARSATPMSQEELAAVQPDPFDKGTNLQYALRLAHRHLRKHAGSEPVVLIVTDGEPTAHNTIDGPVFSWPPARETIEATVQEVDHLARYGASLNFFVLGDDPGLARFVDAMGRRSGGRVFTPEADELGRYVVSDYLRARRGR